MTDEIEAFKEGAKAVQETAKTASNALDKAGEMGKFISKFIGEPLETGIGIFNDNLKYRRWENQLRLIQKAQSYMNEIGLAESDVKHLPMKFAVPLLEGAALEDEDEIQDMWAILLVNSANIYCSIDLNRVYIDILERLKPIEAKILDVVYSLPLDSVKLPKIITENLPASASLLAEGETDGPAEPDENVKLALANLIQIGCLKGPSLWDGGEGFKDVHPTLLGKRFFEACTLSRRLNIEG